MNDFTKDELQEIKRCLKYMIDGGVTPYSNLTMELNKKIQGMIENYNKCPNCNLSTHPANVGCRGLKSNGTKTYAKEFQYCQTSY